MDLYQRPLVYNLLFLAFAFPLSSPRVLGELAYTLLLYFFFFFSHWIKLVSDLSRAYLPLVGIVE